MIGVHPYIAYTGNCREAIDFYKQALGAELIYSMTWGDSPMSEPGIEDMIMHATVKIGDSTIMMCDDPRKKGAAGSDISLAIGMNDIEKAKVMFNDLSAGGNVTMPLDKTFWAEAFGMVTDRFGINWMINCDGRAADAKQADSQTTN